MMREDEDDEVTNPGLIDAREQAWFAGDIGTVQRLASAAIDANPEDAEAVAWLGLAQYVSGQVPAAQQGLRRAFELVRAQAGDGEEAQQRCTWLLHGIANRLTDALADNPSLGLAAARFIVDGLKLDHAPALRLLAEDPATDAVKAATSLKRALAVDATDPETHYLVARLLARIGKKPNVIKHLQAALKYGAGVMNVRTLARYEPDFDGFRHDAEFNALIDTLPTDPDLRPVYAALDAGTPYKVLELAAPLVSHAKQPLDVLYPWREAVEVLLEAGDGDTEQRGKELAKLNERITALEARRERSASWARYCGED